MKKYLIPVLFFILQISSAQELPFRNFTVEDGLAGSVVTYILQDSKGFMWFATQTGVSRFDGVNFKNFTIQDGLSDNTILKIYEDKKENIWFFAFNGIPSYFKNEKINRIDSSQKFSQTYLTSMMEDDCGNLWLGTLSEGLLKIENEKIFSYNFFDTIKFNAVTSIQSSPTDNFWISTDSGILFLKGICLQKLQAYELKEQDELNKTAVLENFKFKTIADTLAKTAHNLFIDAHQMEILSPFSSITPKNYFLKNFKNEIPSFYLEDNEKNIWFSTLLGGVYFLPYYSREWNNYSKPSGLSDNNISTVITNQKGNILVGTGSGKINLINNQQVKIINNNSDNFFADRITCAMKHSNGTIWFGTDGGIKIIRNEKIIENISLRNVNSVCQSANGTVWAGTLNGLYQIKNKSVKNINLSFGIKELKVQSVFAENDSEIWIGCKDGLWKYEDNQLFKWDKNQPLLNNEVSSITVSNDDIIWVATASNGLIAINEKNIHQFTSADGIADDRCNIVFADSSGNIWLGTNKGVSKIHIDDKSTWNFSIVNFSKKDGLLSAEINDIFKEKNILYIATAKGLTVFDETKIITSSIPPPVFITRFLVNEKDSLIKSSYSLSYTQNNIRIDFIALCYGIAGEITYRYKLTGIDTGWKYTQVNSINFPLLPPGSYTFIVSAMNKDGIWNNKTASVGFVIRPPFWQTTPFRITGFLFLLLILFFLFVFISRLIKKREQKKNALQQRILEAEQKAIRAQMNPHFIFNALNSIQRFVVEHDTLSANEYLAKFGKLIRRILDNSKHSAISLSDEIDTLKLYLDLESLRFENRFSYRLIIDPDIDIQQSQVPTMLIQPYIENAIWHGLMNKNNPGQLTVSFQLKNDFIICMIEDDGVGRKKAMELRNKHKADHKSSGMQLIQERLEILNSMRKQKFEIDIIDLINEENEPAGTSVVIKIPSDF